ncbi:ATP-dependent RNA helicase SrmB [Motilimonas eburnea]|uniref:ATP-dependent RNA helicase SrmB n=1 Tax=Motilimonas eburnea TaxID=1737488 RepID=UPI001E3598D1|nr:ATP-dependent RNA helicase SrmB [Motilimonas eburnea]MCE2570898.1 ATP-dependent RNA helicase SrmB [Motilimonas eburnea]
MSFADLELDPTLVDALTRMGLEKPTTIQQEAIPPALDGRDLMASSPTGTGKTLAFLLPAIEHMLNFPRRKPGSPRVLILTPTRELAVQIQVEATKLCQDTPLKVGAIIGGISYQTQEEVLTKNMDLVVATPGRLMEYIEQEAFDCREIEILTLDEADRMLDMGFISTMERIAEEARWRKQTFLFSATLEGKGLSQFAAKVLKEPVAISAAAPRSERGKILQWIHLADNAEHKFELLKATLKKPEVSHAIVFVKTRDRLTNLVTQLEEAGIKCCFLRGEMEQAKRTTAIMRFKTGKVNVLVATDVAARGIDVPEISHVINYDMPRTADIYLHRIGRTARGGRKGTAISLIEAHDMEILGKVERYMKEPLKRRVIDSLRPKNKEATIPAKKKRPTAKADNKKSAPKQKVKAKKNKGKPNWAKKAKK